MKKKFVVIIPLAEGWNIVGQVEAESELEARVVAKIILRSEFPRFKHLADDVTAREVAA
jgi:hypothetical protein